MVLSNTIFKIPEWNESRLLIPFTVEEVYTDPKNGKAPGIDNVMTEQIKHFGEEMRMWLVKFFNNIITQNNIPTK